MELEAGRTDRPLLHVPLAMVGDSPIGNLSIGEHVLEMPAEGFQSLREKAELGLDSAKKEIQARRPEGATLDQATARQRQVAKVRALTETHLL